MILINLLPHREMAREQARKTFKVSLVVALAVGLAITGLIYLWYQAAISMQEKNNEFLVAENKKLDAEIKDVATLQQEIDALKARQTAVENLQSDRNMPVHLMNEAVRQLPDGVYLKSIKQDKNNVLLGGMAQSQERVSELLRNLSRNSEWMTTPELIEIAAANIALSPREQRRAYQFTVRVQLQRASDVASAASAAQAAASKGT